MPSMGDKLPPVEPGDPIRASAFNDLTSQVNALSNVGESCNVLYTGIGVFRRPCRQRPPRTRQARIVKPQSDIEPGGVGRCDVYEGPLGGETATGDTVFGYSHGLLIEAGTRCWAEHYSRVRGAEPRSLSSAELSEGSVASSEDAVAEWELFPTEC